MGYREDCINSNITELPNLISWCKTGSFRPDVVRIVTNLASGMYNGDQLAPSESGDTFANVQDGDEWAWIDNDPVGYFRCVPQQITSDITDPIGRVYNVFVSNPIVAFGVNTPIARREIWITSDPVIAFNTSSVLINAIRNFAASPTIAFNTVSDGYVENRFVSGAAIAFDISSELSVEKCFTSTANIIFNTLSDITFCICFESSAAIDFNTSDPMIYKFGFASTAAITFDITDPALHATAEFASTAAIQTAFSEPEIVTSVDRDFASTADIVSDISDPYLNAGTGEIEISAPVTLSHDDGYWRRDIGTWGDSVSRLTLGREGHGSWFRFTDVEIPQGANITGAFVRYWTWADQYDVGGITEHLLEFEDADDAVAPISQIELDAIPRTTANVQWDIPYWADGEHIEDSIDISALAQEVVDRPGWESGNAMQLLITGLPDSGVWRYVCSWDHTEYPAPELFITYRAPLEFASTAAIVSDISEPIIFESDKPAIPFIDEFIGEDGEGPSLDYWTVTERSFPDSARIVDDRLRTYGVKPGDGKQDHINFNWYLEGDFVISTSVDYVSGQGDYAPQLVAQVGEDETNAIFAYSEIRSGGLYWFQATHRINGSNNQYNSTPYNPPYDDARVRISRVGGTWASFWQNQGNGQWYQMAATGFGTAPARIMMRNFIYGADGTRVRDVDWFKIESGTIGDRVYTDRDFTSQSGIVYEITDPVLAPLYPYEDLIGHDWTTDTNDDKTISAGAEETSFEAWKAADFKSGVAEELTAPFEDLFDEVSLDPEKWTIEDTSYFAHYPTGDSIRWDSSESTDKNGHTYFNYLISGDFDIQMDYMPDAWADPASSLHYCGIWVTDPTGTDQMNICQTRSIQEYFGNKWANRYVWKPLTLDDHRDVVYGVDQGADLRITRVGSVVKCWFWDIGDARWEWGSSGASGKTTDFTSTDDVRVSLYAKQESNSLWRVDINAFNINSADAIIYSPIIL